VKLEDDVAALAKVHKLLGHVKEAREGYDRNVTLVTERAVKEPGKGSASDLADAYQARAEFEANRGDRLAAVGDYRKSMEWVLKSNANSVSALRKVAAMSRRVADLEFTLGNSAGAKQDYEQAFSAGERAIGSYQQEQQSEYQTQRVLALSYEETAIAKLGLGDRKSAEEHLAKALQASRTASSITRQALGAKPTLELKKQAVEDYGSLAWIEVLNNHPKEAIDVAQEALGIDPAQPWIHGNLAHAYLLLNQPDKARECYLANRGEEVNGDLFELSVLEDLELLRRLGYHRAEMAAVEQMMGK
jgi:tetratricopeptide (TPR) repeat protein